MVALAGKLASSACQLDGQQRQALALAALGGASISEMSREHDVSRKFIYQQKGRATQVLQDAFAPSDDDEKVLFDLPVTKTWLRGLVLGLLLTCRGSFRGVRELLNDHFGCSFSVGAIHNYRHGRCRTGSRDQSRSGSFGDSLRSTRRNLPKRETRAGRCRSGIHVLLPASRGRASRRRHVGVVADGIARARVEITAERG